MLRILLTIVLCIFAMPALAQEYNKSMQMISELNRIQAPQNPNYERSEKILTRRVIDRKNRVIGEVQDVIFRSNGGLKSIKVDFNRLNLSQPVYLNYRELDMRTSGRSYQMSIEDKQVDSLYPQLLADIETASGPGVEDFSLRKMLNANVTTANGKIVGKISDVLFSAEGDRAEAIYVRMADGVLNGKQVAVPVDALQLSNSAQGFTAVASDDLASAMNDFAAQK